uniref:Ras protein specific guanine nucleotide releasing factor 1 n=1 Tax=Petromyzon marinus TaxID=7757 RepID=S4S047_PETMA
VVSLNRSKERLYAVGEDSDDEDEDPDIRKIKKVQSFLRGWLCRRKWKAIVQDYIRSPQAESRRKRNQLVFSMLEAEGEYVAQLRVLVTGFLRPLRMAASSKRPPICHDDVSAVFLNSETIMFLHQIFHQGLKARIASWPTIVLADLFDMLLPMLNIYQEFVRNHQFSLQVLANCKQNREFDKLLKQYESRAECEERTLETFLTFPMYQQIPRYIVTLHELLAHTPQEHVERRSLEFAKSKLEELSRIIHDEVSETENIRKNLAIERMIVEGCGILLDTSQTFVRQGSLLQVSTAEKGRMSRGRLGSLTSKKEGERQCFLFTKHLIICTRASGGKLHLNKNGGVLPLLNCTLLEDLEPADDEAPTSSARSAVQDLEFRLAIEAGDTPPCIVLVAASRQQKAAWTSDISQCIDNLRCNGLMMNVFEDNSKISVPQMVRSDRSLYCDGADIRFSRTLDSCKVPVIRAASVSRLLERLTDPRFLSIDFLNTFLYSYRVFTTATALLARLAAGYRRPLSAVPVKDSLELFFSSSLPGRPHYGEPPKSPRACRKFSTPLSPTSPPGAVIAAIATSPPPGTSGGSAVIVGVSVSVSEAPVASDTDADASPLAATPAAAGAAVSEPASPLTSPTCLPAPGAIAGVPSPFRGRRKMSLNAPLIHEPPVHAALPRGADDAAASSAGSPDGRGGSGTIFFFFLFSFPQKGVFELCPVAGRCATIQEFPLFHVGSTAEVGGETQEKIRRLSLAGTRGFSIAEHRMLDKEFIIRRAVTNRVLNVLRHWVSKHSQDFESDSDLKSAVVRLLEEISRDTELIGQERKAAANILR